tara:strand:- start:378 stop:800 length:423 start_codon:yes stop_codon:yes gene_type:complete
MDDDMSIPKLTKLAETIGFEIVEFTEGRCVVELTVSGDHLNAGGVAHGGIHATMLDTAMGGTLVTTLRKEEWCATAQLDLSYLEPSYPGDVLRAEGSVVRRGRNIAHLEGVITNSEGSRISHARGTWAIWEKRPQSLRES